MNYPRTMYSALICFRVLSLSTSPEVAFSYSYYIGNRRRTNNETDSPLPSFFLREDGGKKKEKKKSDKREKICSDFFTLDCRFPHTAIPLNYCNIWTFFVLLRLFWFFFFFPLGFFLKNRVLSCGFS